MKKRYFHSIDSLRFFAFLKVYFLHIPFQGSFPIFSFLKSGGGIGVSFFFVLSGFLISYLLILEKVKETQINIKKFFFRRAFRIWPLYFLMVIIVFLIPFDFKEKIGFHMVGAGYDLDWKYSFTFLENYKMLITDKFPKTTPLPVFWSLCIEEHFYIFWMISLFIIPMKHVLKFLFICIVISWGSRAFEETIFNNNLIVSNDLFANLDYFAIGGLLGYFIVTDYQKTIDFIQKISIQIKRMVVILVVLVVVFQKYILPNEFGTLLYIIRPSIIALLFTILISIFLPENSSFKIKSKLLSFLGARGYGLYIYHIIFIHCSFQYCIVQNIKIDNWLTLGAFIAFTLGGSIIVSSISYKYLEMPFLSLREKNYFN
tara:strand:+ start:660 stop:1775 length:1116 start_codon:yes stop_codon:yes gene_type:complete